MLRSIAVLFTIESCQIVISDALDQVRQRTSLSLSRLPVGNWIVVHDEQSASAHPLWHLAVEAVLKRGVALLGEQDKMAGDILELYYFHRYTIQRIINRQGYAASVPTIRRRRLEALEKLAQLFYAQEMAAREAWTEQALNKLPPPQQAQLFGRNPDINRLTQAIANSTDNWLINLTGMGGLGKSALAHATVRQLIHSQRLLHCAWVEIDRGMYSAELIWYDIIKQTAHAIFGNANRSFAQLEQRVKQAVHQTPHLIVIDNLEEVDDSEQLVRRLWAFANPSKILLVSRRALTTEIPMLQMRLQSLSPLATEAYIRKRAERVGVLTLPNVDDVVIRRIYALVGGHPQALKLFVQLCGYFAIDEVLAEFESAETHDIETLYSHIFGRVLAKQSAVTQQLMMTMQIAPAVGLPLSLIEVYSGLSKRDYWEALKQLHLASLVESHQRGGQTLHYIHSLTETYLTHNMQSDTAMGEQIIAACEHWQQVDDASDSAFERDHPFISRVVRVGLRYMQTWRAVCQLMNHYFLRIENSSWWYVWLPLFEQAIAVAPDSDPLLLMRLQSHYAFLLVQNDETARATEMHHAALQIARLHNERKQEGRHHIHLAQVCLTAGVLDSAEKHALAARNIFAELNLPSAFHVIANGTLAKIAHEAGDLSKANKRFASVLTPLDTSLPPTMLVRQLNGWGNTLRFMGDFAAAKEKYTLALEYASGQNDQTLALIGLCCLYLDSGDVESAANTLTVLPHDRQDTALSAQYAAFIAECNGRYLLFRREIEQGVARLQSALSLRQHEHRVGVLAETHAWLSIGLMMLNEHGRAGEHRTKALGLLATAPMQWQAIYRERLEVLYVDAVQSPHVTTAPLELLVGANRARATATFQMATR